MFTRTAHTPVALLVGVVLSAVSAITTPALAQATDARSVLQAASDALAATESGSAQWIIDGIAPAGPFADIKPSGFGQVKWVRQGDTATARFTGQISRTQKAEPETIDFAFSPGKAVTLLADKKTFLERNPDGRPHESLATARKLMTDFWIEPVPFAYELDNATEISLLDPVEIGGVPCDVVECKLPELEAAQKRALPRRSANLIRIYIAQSDSLPRKIEAIADSPFISIGESLELTNLQTGQGLIAADVEIAPPEGWRVDSNLTGDKRTKSVGAADPAQTGNPAAPSGQTRAPTREPRPVAADFSFTTDDGRTVTKESQRGRVTVLYFWGSWCLPCRAFSPLISEIAANAAEAPMDVFGLAVRERSPDATREIMSEGDYAHTLVLDADHLASDFRVRVYPTIVVIDKEGRVMKTVRPEPGKTAKETMAVVSAALETAVGE
ncbi:MAG: thiol-disulfide isomerase/thioredoxin [Phycisphaerales bacterium]|jgi:thiol-disulfide isomerase/thioredoxin